MELRSKNKGMINGLLSNIVSGFHRFVFSFFRQLQLLIWYITVKILAFNPDGVCSSTKEQGLLLLSHLTQMVILEHISREASHEYSS